MTPKQVIEFAKENGALMVDYKFMDFVGTWQHVSVPMTEFSEDTFEEGQGFDGSSIRGWQPIHASDERFIYRLGHCATHGYADVFIYHSKPVYFLPHLYRPMFSC